MKPETIARVHSFSAGGRGNITIAAGAFGGWDVNAGRKAVHGFADFPSTATMHSSGHVASTVEANASTKDPSAAGLDACINAAIDACLASVQRWPLTGAL